MKQTTKTKQKLDHKFSSSLILSASKLFFTPTSNNIVRLFSDLGP